MLSRFSRIHSRSGRCCRSLFLFVLATLLLPGTAAALKVTVTVTGLEGELLKNVLATLELNRHKDNPRLSPFEVLRLHEKAEEDIRAGLAPFGYYGPKVTAQLREDGENYYAEYAVAMGAPVHVTEINVKVDGPGIKDLRGVEEQFPLKVGDVLDQRQYEEGKRKLTIAAMRKGYMKAGFKERQLRIHRQDRSGEVHLVLDSGPQFLFGETLFDDDTIRHRLLARYLTYKPGDPYRPGRLIELQRQLYRTDFFDRVVVDGQLDAAEDQMVPVSVRLTPAEHRNRYSVGVGFATDTGPRVRFGWRNRLLNSYGHQVNLETQISQLDSNLVINYDVPWRDPKTDSLGYTLGYHDKSWDDTDTNLFTTGVQVEHRGTPIWHTAALEFRNEDYSVGVTSGSSILLVPSYTGKVTIADDLLHTKYGLDLSLSVSGGTESFFSDADFLKTVLGGKTVITLMPGLRVIGRGSIGAIMVDDITEMPPSLRFYAGGDQSIRGYGYREIGTEDSSGAVVGGRYLAVASGELEKSITPGWSVAAFWDVGNAVDDLSLDFKQGVGGGIRYRLPFGQVRLDVASAITEDGTPLRVHLTVGADL